MTRAQYEALIEVWENGERVLARELNIHPQTFNDIVEREWIEIFGGYANVTEAGWVASEASFA